MTQGEAVKILLVDDDPMMRMLVKGHLDDDSYDIEEAVDGLDGLAKLANNEYDLALVDLYMPGMDGEQLLKKIRDDNRFIGLVVLTSEENVDVSFRLLEQYDISDYIVKPMCTEMQLKFSVKNAVNRRNFLIQQDQYITTLEYLKYQAEEAKSHFLTQMSHELNTPMNVILGFSQLLESMDQDFTEKQKSYIKHIVKAGWNMMEMIEKILRLSSADFDILDIELKPVCVDDIVEDALAHLKPEAQKRSIDIIHQRQELLALADEVQLRVVIYSLISNAIIYNKDRGSVIIETSCKDNTFTLSVTDTGSGIDPEQQEKLFMPFNRLGAELQTVSGAGVSLALARRLTAAMKGEIGCTSQVGLGSTFYVELQPA